MEINPCRALRLKGISTVPLPKSNKSRQKQLDKVKHFSNFVWQIKNNEELHDKKIKTQSHRMLWKINTQCEFVSSKRITTITYLSVQPTAYSGKSNNGLWRDRLVSQPDRTTTTSLKYIAIKTWGQSGPHLYPCARMLLLNLNHQSKQGVSDRLLNNLPPHAHTQSSTAAPSAGREGAGVFLVKPTAALMQKIGSKMWRQNAVKDSSVFKMPVSYECLWVLLTNNTQIAKSKKTVQ